MSICRFARNVGTRNYKPVVVIATEGSVTEPSYFEKFKPHGALACGHELVIKIVPSGQDSSPSGVLKSLKKYLKKEPLSRDDEAWIVIDRDTWPVEQINAVVQSLDKLSPEGQCHLALSNPKFEFWVLLHFEDGHGVATASECDHGLKKYLSGYKKDLGCWNPSLAEVRHAISRAKSMDTKNSLWPETRGTTVYRLVDRLIAKK